MAKGVQNGNVLAILLLNRNFSPWSSAQQQGITPKQFNKLQKSDLIIWSCPECTEKGILQCDTNLEYLSALPFAAVVDLSHLIHLPIIMTTNAWIICPIQ